MNTKKERIMGREFTFARSPLQAVRAFFGTKPKEAKTVLWGTPGFRKYKKEIREVGLAEKWGGLTPARERER